MIDAQRLVGQADSYGVELSAAQARQLDAYARLLVEHNQKINLTAITQPQQIEEKHFLDSLLCAAAPEMAGKVVDVGSGAGFPGLVAKIYRPELQLTLMEPTGKRLAFLQKVAEELGLEVELVKERAEEAAKKGCREQFTTATARAVAPLNILCEYCLPLVKPGGWFIAMKGEAQEELVGAQNAIGQLGGALRGARTFALPGGDARTLVLIEKVAPTPEKYPRAGGVIKKRPL